MRLTHDPSRRRSATAVVAVLVALGSGAAACTTVLVWGSPPELTRLAALACLLPIGAYGVAAARARASAVRAGVVRALTACAAVGTSAVVGLAVTEVSGRGPGVAFATLAVLAAVVAIVVGNVGTNGRIFHWAPGAPTRHE